ncbi:Ligand-gated ion channel, partial [Ostertagia ostertagi]
DGPWYPCPKYGYNYTSHHCCAGYAIDLLSNLSLPEPNTTIDTSFTFSLHLNDSYGAVILGEKGYILTGALGELDSDQADLAIGGMTINPERERYIDFSEPWSYHGIRILEKSIPRDSPMQSFLQPLKSSLWTALFISVITVGLVIFCLDLKSPFDRFYRNEPPLGSPTDLFLEQVANDRVNFGEAMWFVWGVLLNSGVKTPELAPARVLRDRCVADLCMNQWWPPIPPTWPLFSFWINPKKASPASLIQGAQSSRCSFQLRNPSANFSFGTVLNSNVYQYFKRHVELSTMFRKMEAHNVEKVPLPGRFHLGFYSTGFEAARHCVLRTRGALFGRSAYGVGLQKNSPWTPHITSAILRMTESGVMENLDAKWIDNRESKCVTEAHKSPARLSLWNMRDVFILVTGGVAAGALFSTIEVIYGVTSSCCSICREMADDGLRWVPIQQIQPVSAGHQTRFAGLEPCSLAEIRKRELNRSKQKVANKALIRPPAFVPDLNFGRQSVVSLLQSMSQSGPNRRASRVWPVRVRVVYGVRVAVLVAMLRPLPMLQGSPSSEHLCMYARLLATKIAR